ncbi:thioredoxin family protein [Clostridium sp. MT-14]|jgi:thioredoxin 1|uniref:Thioredoxin family protein n=1 Tax=Clostridium aromativorans TaxID=2836848 RepID=A0ABS8NAM8_9CLOT|nr:MULTISPECIES: thioredoxin family protein [Clostridium]KAA8664166.1 thioredoxin [Clostridium sp. HV4-5-A1G]MCC9296871.1 thioredoxin family protein [Clostridium aromativorans]CAB1248613.1 Thioredoxin [Clostridiaceae bacterium BL-3]
MIELTKQNFDEEVLNCADKPVFVDYWGDKCEICKQLMPGVHGLEDKYGDKIKFSSLNISKARRLAIGQKVLGLPTMVLYNKGEKVNTITADKIKSLDDVEEFVKSYYATL